MESIAVIPVCTGSQTDLRVIIPGAIDSTSRVSDELMSPLPSIGRAKASTTRPKKASPTGTCAILPVERTVLPSRISKPLPINTTPTLSFSRFNAIPIVLSSNSSSSPAITCSSP
jgi:hypothetical protein